jgi:hypothetical protein
MLTTSHAFNWRNGCTGLFGQQGSISEYRFVILTSNLPRAEYEFVKYSFAINSLFVRLLSALLMIGVASASVDNDGDGMLDDWEIQFFGSSNAARGGANADFDGDGSSNLAEFRSGTNPTNALSRFAVSRIQHLTSSQLLTAWPSTTGRVYNLELSTNLANGYRVVATNLPAQPPENMFTSNVSNAGTTFYRVRLLPMFIGAANTVSNGSGMTYQQSWTGLENAVGPLGIRRSYASSLVTSFPSTVAAIDLGKRASLFSFKANWTEMAAGTYDEQVRNLVRSIPSNHLAYLCWFHEPENDGAASAFVPAFRRFSTAAKSVGRPNVKVTLILMTWTWDPASGRNPADWWPGAQYVDAVGLDGYNPYDPTKNGSNWKTFASVFQTATDWLRSQGAKEIGAAETGCKERVGDPNAKANWLRDAVKWADSQRYGFFCYFDSNVGDDGGSGWWLRSSPAATESYRNLAASHY